jgi:molybdopterin synthase catalytic subunit
MQISIRAFASYREAIGSPRITLTIPDGASPGQVWKTLLSSYPRLRALPQPFAFAVNDEYVTGEVPLRPRDELVLVPPVSGGSEYIDLVETPIDINAVLKQVNHAQAGAVVVFLGTVRDNNRGRHVKYLEYEAYQTMARKEMQKVAADAQRRWPVLSIAIVHRLGHLEIGEISVAIAVAAGHRSEAFEAAQFAIDTLKHTVPIWKKEVWADGAVWIGSEPTAAGAPLQPLTPRKQEKG